MSVCFYSQDNFDDFDFEDTADLSNFQDLDLYGTEDTWMSVSVSFNPYQCDLSNLEVWFWNRSVSYS